MKNSLNDSILTERVNEVLLQRDGMQQMKNNLQCTLKRQYLYFEVNHMERFSRGINVNANQLKHETRYLSDTQS